MKDLLMKTYQSNLRYLNTLNKMFGELKRPIYRGTRAKTKDGGDINKFQSLLSEFSVGMIFGRRGCQVEFLPDNYMDRRSPDIHVTCKKKGIYVEVTRATDDGTNSEIQSRLRESLKDKPFRVDVKMKPEMAPPATDWQERMEKSVLVRTSLEEFERKLQNEIEDPKAVDLPIEIDCIGAVFTVSPAADNVGYPGIVSTGVFQIPDDKIADMLTHKIIEKSRKREDWTGRDREMLYVIGIDFEEFFCSLDFDTLLLGKTTEFLILDESDRDIIEKEWEKIADNPQDHIPHWERIENAADKGWKEFLANRRLIPRDLIYLKGEGLFMKDQVMDNVSGILALIPGDKILFVPNPFASDEINDPGLTSLL